MKKLLLLALIFSFQFSFAAVAPKEVTPPKKSAPSSIHVKLEAGKKQAKEVLAQAKKRWSKLKLKFHKQKPKVIAAKKPPHKIKPKKKNKNKRKCEPKKKAQKVST